MKQIKDVHSGHRQRLRARINTSDIDDMEEYQILEYLLTYSIPRKDTNELAHNLINTFGSLSNVLDADINYLLNIEGVGEKTASFLTSLPKIFKKYRMINNNNIHTINNPADAIDYCKNILQFLSYEELYLVLIDANSYIMKCVKISSGTKFATNGNIRKITEYALQLNARAVLISHNHPNNNPTPSEEDNRFTESVTRSLQLNGVHILDHIIVTADGYYSYHLDHKLEEYRIKDNQFFINCPPPPYN